MIMVGAIAKAHGYFSMALTGAPPGRERVRPIASSRNGRVLQFTGRLIQLLHRIDSQGTVDAVIEPCILAEETPAAIPMAKPAVTRFASPS